MNKVKISSITYVKNGKEYIEQCVRSVMNQTMKEIEIFVVDGGSTDGTLDILEQLQREDERIQVLKKEGSVGAQFNAALNNSTGEYIAVCEGDDYILPDKYEKQYKIASENKLDVLRAGYYQFFNYGEKEYQYKVDTAPSKDYHNRLVEVQRGDSLFLSQGVNGFWNGLYLRKFLVDNAITMNETPGAAYQDVSFSFLCQAYARRIWFMEEALHCYRIDNSNASVNSTRCIDMHIREYELLQKRIKASGKWNDFQQMFLVWEIRSYKHFIDQLPDENRAEETKKLYKVLKEQKIQGPFETIPMSQHSRKLIDALYTDEDAFTEILLNNSEQNNRLIQYFENQFPQEQRVVLFGVGYLGSMIYDFLTACGKEIVILDNNPKLQENGYRGKKVHNPNDYIATNDDTIIVANVMYAKEIREQLCDLGIPNSRIIICDNTDLFLRKIFVGIGRRTILSDRPLVSIVIPAYNLENYIEECLQSILSQTYDNLQIIVVNDGSMDRTGEICDAMAAKDLRIEVIHQTNQGVVTARQTGIDRANGKYMMFIDGDDFIEPDMIAYMVEHIGSSQLISTGVIRETAPGYYSNRLDDFEEGTYADARMSDIFSRMIFDERAGKLQPFTPWLVNKLFITSLVKDVFFGLNKKLKYGEDCVAVYQYLLNCTSVTISHCCFYHYRYREESAIHKTDIKAITKITDVYEELISVFKACSRGSDIGKGLIHQLQRWYVVGALGAINERMGFAKDIYIVRFVPNLMGFENKKIVLYAAGRVGQDYYRQIKNTNIHIVAWVDKNYKNCVNDECEIEAPEELSNKEFDYLLIAIESESVAQKVKQELEELGIPEAKIVWRKPYILY